MFYLGQTVKVTYGTKLAPAQSLGVLVGKSITTPTGGTDRDTGVWYRVLCMDDDNPKAVKPYLFKDGNLGYVYDKSGKVMFGKTRTKKLCTLTSSLEETKAHDAEVKRVNADTWLEINGII